MRRTADLGQILLAGGVALFLALAYHGVAPPHHDLPLILAGLAEPGRFAADPFLADPSLRTGSLLYWLAGVTGVSTLGGDLVGYPLHLVAGGAVLVATVTMVRRRMTGGDLTSALLAVLVVCLMPWSLAGGAWSVPALGAITPAGLADLCVMTAVLLGLGRRPALAALAAALGVMLAPQGNFLIAPAVGVWLVLDRSLPRVAMLWGLVPLVAAGWMLAGLVASFPADLDVATAAALVRRDGAAASFLGQPAYGPLLVLAACVWSLSEAWRRSDDPTLRAVLAGLGGLTLVAWAAAMLYPLVAAISPQPLWSALWLPQAMRPLVWLAALLAAASVAASSRLSGTEKVLLLVALLVVRPSPLWLGLAGGLAAVVLVRMLARERLGWGGTGRWSPAAVLSPLVLVLILDQSGGRLAAPAWIDRVALAQSGLWSAGVFADEPTWRSWTALAAEPDYPLVALYDNQAYRVADLAAVSLPVALAVHPSANLAAAKSPFLPPTRFLSADPAVLAEAARREAVIAELVRSLGRGEPLSSVPLGTVKASPGAAAVTIDRDIVTFLSERRMAVLVPSGLARLFPADLPRRGVGGQVLIGFGLVP